MKKIANCIIKTIKAPGLALGRYIKAMLCLELTVDSISSFIKYYFSYLQKIMSIYSPLAKNTLRVRVKRV